MATGKKLKKRKQSEAGVLFGFQSKTVADSELQVIIYQNQSEIPVRISTEKWKDIIIRTNTICLSTEKWKDLISGLQTCHNQTGTIY